MNSYFEDDKYIEAAEKARQFIKNQLNINNFKYNIEFAKEYSSSFVGDVLYGFVTGLSGSESKTSPKYLSLSRYYDYSYKGAVEGSWTGLSTSYGVNVYVTRDQTYKFKTYKLSDDGTWKSQTLYKEIYIVPDLDPITGIKIGEHEEEIEYYLDDEVGVGIKDFRVATGISESWEVVKKTKTYTVKKQVFKATGEIALEDGGGVYPYFNDFLVRIYSYGDAEYLCDECKIFSTGGGLLFYTIKAKVGRKIGKIIQITYSGYEIVGIAGTISNIDNGRIPASFYIPTDDPQYDKDGSKAKWIYGYCLNERTWAYDVGLALLVFTTSGDYDICEEMLDRMQYEQNSDGSFNFSYDIYIGQLFEGYVRTGAMGWLLWGMCYYQLETGDTSYQSMIEKGCDWLISRQITSTDDPRYGLITGGIGTYNQSDYSYIDGDIEWCATEHQCSALQALEGASLISKKSKYKKAAELVRDQLYVKCYDAENKRFYQGINSGIPDSAWALDCTTWAGTMAYSIVNSEASKGCMETAKDVYLTKNKSIIQSSDESHYNQRYSSSDTFKGFKPYSDLTPDYEGAPDIVWSEGTLGYALLAYILGKEEECVKYVDEMIKLQNVDGSTGGILYVTETYGDLPWEFHVWESVVSSAWLYLIIYNPAVLFPRTLRQVYYMAKITNIHDERP